MTGIALALLTGAAAAGTVLAAARTVATRLRRRRLGVPVGGLGVPVGAGLDTLASGLSWWLGLFLVPAMAIRYELGFGSWLLAAVAGLLVIAAATVAALREVYDRLPPAGPPATVRRWLLGLATAALLAAVAAAAATATQTRLVNSAPILRWNSDKTYLGELAAKGVPTVPTTYLRPGGPTTLPEYDEFVVKPSVGGGARGAGRFRADQRDAALAHVAQLHAEGLTAMAQPYQTTIDRDGERSLVYFGGEFSHAIVKGAVLSAVTGRRGEEAHPNPRPHLPSAAEHEVALAAMAAAPETPLYGRLDLVLGADGRPIVMEAELIEPYLFLASAPGAEDRLISVVAKAL